MIYKLEERNFDKIINIPFFNNTFLLVHSYKTNVDPLNNSLIQFQKERLNSKDINAVLMWKGARKFRIVTSLENKLTAVRKDLLSAAEKKLLQVFKLKVDRVKPEIEFWFLTRSEGITLLGLRLTKHKTTEKSLMKGQLRLELASLLCWISEPQKNDVFWDPFCGYGSIPLARIKMGAFRKVIGTDIDRSKISNIKSNQDNKKNIDIFYHDFFSTETVIKVNKIVTDPPWGEFAENNQNMEHLYHMIFKNALIHLEDNGVMVLLVSRIIDIEKIILYFADRLEIVERYFVLVSGKKASVYKFVKR